MVVAPLVSTKGLRKLRPRCGLALLRGPEELALIVEMRSSVVGISSYLVDPASSHMLVSKIKPCMSKYKQVCTVKLRMAH
jgi:hypothetical protein